MSKGTGEKKDNTMTIAIIGLIGTLVAAILGSPVLITLIEKQQATATAPVAIATTASANVTTLPTVGNNQVLIFQESFDNDKVSGFAFEGNGWSIAKDKSNQVLDGGDVSASRAIFGPSDFSNGIIEFSINVQQFAPNQSAAINFRTSNQTAYSLAFHENQITLGYRDGPSDASLVPLSSETSRSLVFEKDTWYLVRIDVRGPQITVFIDNNRLFGADDLRLQKGGLNFSLGPGVQAMFDDVKVWDLQ